MVQRKKIGKADLGRWLDIIAKKYELIGPTKDEEVHLFRPVSSSAELDLEYANSLIPPKSLFFPQVEGLFAFHKRGEQIELEEAKPLEKDRVVVGIRNCDVSSLSLLDRVFIDDLEDSYYRERRDRTVLIALACPTPPRSSCFCTTFGIDPLSPEGSDVLLTDVGDLYLVDVVTERGQELVALGEDLFSALTEAEGKELQPPPVDMPALDVAKLKEKLDTLWEDEYWDKLSLPCLGCGICTYVCPTCHCFDISDVGSTSAGIRYRCWDSCMYGDFALMASGENARPTRRERTRNRYFHKFSSFPSRYGTGYACVGCARCLVHCPGGVEITEVISDILAKEAVSDG
jgi:sulfhydrogenase subunit beta (sulfur reductase)